MKKTKQERKYIHVYTETEKKQELKTKDVFRTQGHFPSPNNVRSSRWTLRHIICFIMDSTQALHSRGNDNTKINIWKLEQPGDDGHKILCPVTIGSVLFTNCFGESVIIIVLSVTA
ncbi:hypothetical protein ElyMa_004645900 [Elysia marginata]|uniref:Uncharacterized protein n=1 Tax=Elysia marginata TaxID=1093978 RepID=A0AAV4I395_9GAST|nr:hypothetical protein ElyMa_004645900 [Elysia marginata]